jgi:hemoglobin-like flavoprotein
LVFDTFYQRLFDIHPSVKPLFKNGLITQGRFLVKMISMLLGSLNNQKEFDESLYKLVVTHNTHGMNASEYGMIGEIIFYTLKRCTGPTYNVEASRAWIPKAIALELEISSGAQRYRFKLYD